MEQPKEERELAKLVVIDDIRSVVDMIATAIPWATHGIGVVGRARDGEEGLALVERERPDIVITDIRMPKLDGLAMTERILRIAPQCKVIILSGYADFEYARQAIRLGATDFVKKPFTVEDIVNVTLKAKALWLEDRERRQSLERLKRQVRASMPTLRQEYLTQLVQFQASGEKARELWSFLDVDLAPNDVTALVVEIDDFDRNYSEQPVQEIELVRFSLQNILEETVRDYGRGVLFRESTRRFVLLLGAASPARATEIAEACCANIRKFTKFTVSIGVGAPAQDVVDLPSSYREALTALSYHYYTGGDGVFHIDAAARVGAGRPAHSQRLEESLAFALQSGNAELAAETLDALVREMKELRPYPQPEAAAETVAEWAALVCRALHGRVSDEKLAPLVERARALRAQRGLSLTRQRELVLALATDGCKLMLEERQHESRKTIRRAAEFIQSHLGEELSVDRCAREVNLSGGYFANLFKKEMGVTFNQYVTQERIDRAKKLLVAGVPVQDIALDLGYEHRRYFSDVFKKHTGMTPSDFKEFYARGASLD